MGVAPSPPEEREPAARRFTTCQLREKHDSCSVLAGRIANKASLLSLPPEDRFNVLHRIYCNLDRIAEEHKVHKLYGGEFDFLMATNVAEADNGHPTTLFKAAQAMLQAAAEILLPSAGGSPEPLQLVLALASGPMASGLLGKISVTYQLVGEKVAAARELSTYQRMPLMVTCSTYARLPGEQQSRLHTAGRVQLRCLAGQDMGVYTPAQYAGVRLLQPHQQPVPHMVQQAALDEQAGDADAAAQDGEPGTEAEAEAEDTCAPLYKTSHVCCSVLVGSIRNAWLLHSMPPVQQFRWLHLMHLQVDDLIQTLEGHGDPYKLYGGPAGFMVCTNVAVPDDDHAATLLRFALLLQVALKHLKLPGPNGEPVPVQLTMTMASGPAASGLLGRMSLTYQVVGREAALANELNTQQRVPLVVTEGAYHELPPEVQQLCGPPCPVECPGGQRIVVHSAPATACPPFPEPQTAGGALPAAEEEEEQDPEGLPPADQQAASTSLAALSAQQRLGRGSPSGALALQLTAVAAADPGARTAAAAGAERDASGATSEGPPTPKGSPSLAGMSSTALESSQAVAEEASLAPSAAVLHYSKAGKQAGKRAEGVAQQRNGTETRYAMDAVLRFEDPEVEAAFVRRTAPQPGELGASLALAGVGMLCPLALPLIWHSWAMPLLLAAHGLPLLLAALCCWLFPTGAWRCCEALWLVQRVAVAAALTTVRWLGGPAGPFPFAAWVASLAILAVQSCLVLPVCFRLHLLASLLVFDVLLGWAGPLSLGAWAAVAAGEAALALVAGRRERQARRAFVQACQRSSRPLTLHVRAG